MTVIEYAEKRMNECAKEHEDHNTRYFAAYLDGARAQLKECGNNKIFDGYNEFLKLRKRVFDALSKIDMSCGCKSYEGTFEISIEYNNYFEQENDDIYDVVIKLHCYVLGPARHYTWKGKTLLEAVNKCKIDVEQWIETALEDQ